MNKLKFPLILLLVFLGITGGYAAGKVVFATKQPAKQATSCTTKMVNIIESAQGSVYQVSEADSVTPETYYLASYEVSGDHISTPDFKTVPSQLKEEQKDTALHTEAWNLFARIIPPQDREMVAEYIVFTDGYSNTLAAVEQTPDNLKRWMVEVDIADLKDQDALLFTLVHEYAHLLTLDSGQVTTDPEIFHDPKNRSLVDMKTDACPNYFTGDGCSRGDSYINRFYQRFWLDISEEWKAVDALQYDENPIQYYEGLYDFYLTHSDAFVDDYATTHPTEDIAESFAYFVFSPKPAGHSIKEQKIAFFYQYPALVQLRGYILTNLCTGSH